MPEKNSPEHIRACLIRELARQTDDYRAEFFARYAKIHGDAQKDAMQRYVRIEREKIRLDLRRGKA